MSASWCLLCRTAQTHTFHDNGDPNLEYAHEGTEPPAHGGMGERSVGRPTPRHPSSQKFHDLLAELGALHDQKQKDYGSSTDPFKNVRNSQDFGVPAWIGCMVRANDKMKRIQTAASQVLDGGAINMANESVEDSFMDLAVYALIGLVLFREGTDQG